MLKQHLRAETDKMLKQARSLRVFAYIASAIFIIVLAVCGRSLLRYWNRQKQSPTDPYQRRRY